MTITTITIIVESDPPGAPTTYSYTAYASVAEADARLLIDPVRGEAWGGLTVDQRGANLVAATNRLDLLFWQGSKADGATQANAWPRLNMRYCDGSTVPSEGVPNDVETATIIQAGSISLDPGTADAGSSAKNIKSVGAGSTNVEFFTPTVGVPIQDVTVYSLLRCYLTASETSGTALGQYASGTDVKSCFSDVESFGLTRGYS